MSQCNPNYTTGGDYTTSSSNGSNYTLSSSPTSSNNGDYAACTPRSAMLSDDMPGVVVLPDGSSILVDNKATYFAQYPAARVSTENSVRDFLAFHEEKDRKSDREERRKAEKRARKDAEMEAAGLHGCVGGKTVATCRDCAGNGCAYGCAADYEGTCDNCDGKGYVLSDCGKCKEIEKAKKKGAWNRGRKAPVCEED